MTYTLIHKNVLVLFFRHVTGQVQPELRPMRYQRSFFFNWIQAASVSVLSTVYTNKHRSFWHASYWKTMAKGAIENSEERVVCVYVCMYACVRATE